MSTAARGDYYALPPAPCLGGLVLVDYEALAAFNPRISCAERPLGAAAGRFCAGRVGGRGDVRCCTAWCDEADPQCADPAATCEHFPVGYKGEDPSFQTLGACVVAGSLTP